MIDRNLFHVQSVVFPVDSLISAFLWEVRGTALLAALLAAAFFRSNPSLKKLFSCALNYSGKNTVLPLQVAGQLVRLQGGKGVFLAVRNTEHSEESIRLNTPT